MKFNNKSIYIVVYMLVSVAGCINISENGSFVGEHGRILMSTDDEVRAAQKTLVMFEKKGLPENAVGGVLFDGILKSSKKNRHGLITLEFYIESILYGKDFTSLTNVEMIYVLTPPLENGGILIHVGKKYRIYTVYLDGAYRTWLGTGSAPTSQSNDGVEL